MKKKIYVAGPAVFRKDAVEYLNTQKKQIENKGYEALIPLDKNIDFDREPELIRAEIFQKNVEHIKNCDIVIADLNNFRHNEQDSGTIWEIGMAYGLGKEIYIYSEDNRTLLEKTQEEDKNTTTDGASVFDSNEMEIENFGGRFNLMINECVTKFVLGSFEDVLALRLF